MRNAATVCVAILFCCYSGCHSLTLKGEWSSMDKMFHFLAKFGFQKTNPHEGASSQGYIFGNITAVDQKSVHVLKSSGEAMLVLLPRQFFKSFYSNATQHTNADLDTVCQHMFKDLWTEAYDARCQDTGREDFLRNVPCPVDRLCPDEDNPANVITKAQLTYAIKDINNPRFWYLSLAACRLNESCGWQYSGPDVRLAYHLTLVNGRPPAAGHGFFAYQFSCDQQEVGVLVIFCLLVYFCLLLPVQLYATCKQRLRALEVLSAVLSLQALGLVFATGAQIVMGASGLWLGWMWATGELCTLLCESMFLLLLLLLARGWAVTPSTGHCHTPALYLLWGVYTALTILLYTANKVLQPVVEASYQYGSWPGVCALVLRGLLTAWYLWELRATMLAQQHPHTLQFLLQLGAATLVWLVYLPVVVLIAVQVSALWRHKLLLGFRFSADLLAHVFMTYTLYPRRTHPYLVLATPADHCDELDVLDQAPHALHRQWARYTQREEGEDVVEFARSTRFDRIQNNNIDNKHYSDDTTSKFKVEVDIENRYSSVQNYSPLTRDLLDPSREDLSYRAGGSHAAGNGAVLSSVVRPHCEPRLDLGGALRAEDTQSVATLIDLGNSRDADGYRGGDVVYRPHSSDRTEHVGLGEDNGLSSHSGSDSELLHRSGNPL